VKRRQLLRHAAVCGLALLTLGGLAGCKDKSQGNGSTTSGTTGGGAVSDSSLRGNKVTGNEILIGEFASLTGSTSTFGTATHNGIQLAIDEANAAGGINGKQIKLITYDDRSKAEEATTVVTKLVSSDKVLAVLGEVASTRSIAGAVVCQDKGVPMITPSSTNPAVTEKGDFIFRVCFTDDFQAAVVAQFAKDQGYKKVGVLKDIKNDYSVGFAKVFSDKFAADGGTITGEETYQEGEPDFKAQLSRLKSGNPDAILVPGYYSEVGTIARQAKEVGLNVPLIGGDGWDSPELIKGAGTALEGAFFGDHNFSAKSSEANVKKFVDAYKSKYSSEPDALAALGYDAAALLIQGLKDTKELDGRGVRDALAQIKDFPGVTGKITIDEKRNARKSAVIMKVQGPTFDIFKTYTPEQVGL
jgi:branched-chain amino acid transport system substrate-binding protein